jgi:hypothetical protein
MSVLSRHRTLPSQRTAGEGVARKAAPTQPSDEATTTGPSRTALLVSGAVLVAAATVGATSYVIAQNDSASPAGTVDLPFDSEVQRDRAAAGRGRTAAAPADTEAQRDAAAASRNTTGR